MFDEWEEIQRMKRLWDAVRIVRTIPYTLFTFGDSELPYYLVTEGEPPTSLVQIRKGEVRVSRALIITPQSGGTQFENFFDEEDGDSRAWQFLLSRTAAFSNLKLSNTSGPAKIVSDQLEEAIAKLQKQLDDQDEDRVAILTAPAPLAGLAILKYTTNRILESAPGNLSELRERGLLPD